METQADGTPRVDYAKLKRLRQERKMLKQEKRLKRAVTGEVHAQETDGATSVAEEACTLSIAVPGSILDNAQSRELRTYLAGQVARAACIFQVDEVVVYDDMADVQGGKKVAVDEETFGVKTVRRCCAQLARILQYLECPQYLRKYFFPVHDDLQYAGLLNPLDAPHHLRQTDDFTYREGIVSNIPAKAGYSFVNVGFFKDIKVKKELTQGIRVTVKLQPKEEGSKTLQGVVVAPSTPRADTGVYWGYTVRIAHRLSDVFCQGPYPGGYDLTLGTSDKGTSVDDLSPENLPRHKHILVVFGGVQGLEVALESDDKLTADDPSLLFDHYLNTCPGQGSRTIRTEEAINISLAVLRPKLSLCSQTENFKHLSKD